MATLEIVYVTAGLSALIVAFWKTKKLHKTTDWERRNNVIIRTWLFCIFIFATAIVAQDESYVVMSRITGINNISWLLVYLFTSLAIYMISGGLDIILYEKTSKWSHIFIGVELVLLFTLFFTGISSSPLAIYHESAADLHELLFMEVAYAYITVMCVYAVYQFSQLIESGREFTTRVRWSVSAVSPIFASLFFAGRLIYVPLVYIYPSLEHEAIHAFIGNTFVVASVTWPIFYLPNRLFELLGKPILFLNDLMTFYDLNYLQREMDKICPRIVQDQETWLKKLAQLDMHIYRSIIGILDGKQVLGSYINQQPEPELILIGNNRLLNGRYTPQTQHPIYTALNQADDTADYPQLIEQYRAIAKAYRRGGAA